MTYTQETQECLSNQGQTIHLESHISGEGFPFLTSSPPIMTEKESFHPAWTGKKIINSLILTFIEAKEHKKIKVLEKNQPS